jgi:hypothetical protein
MNRVFNFVFRIQKNENLRNRIYKLDESKEDEEFDIEGWHLFFDKKRSWVVVTNNGTMEYLKYKFGPAEMSFETLIHLMDPSKFGEDFEEQVRYLDD